MLIHNKCRAIIDLAFSGPKGHERVENDVSAGLVGHGMFSPPSGTLEVVVYDVHSGGSNSSLLQRAY